MSRLKIDKSIALCNFLTMREKKPSPLLQRIFELRKAKKISLTKLGEVMGGVTNATASHIENGDIPLKAQYLPAIAKLLGVETWQLFLKNTNEELMPVSQEEKNMILVHRKIKSGKR